MNIAYGKRVPHTPGSAVSEGQGVLLGTMLGVATEPIAAGELGALAIEGVFVLPKSITVSAIAKGAPVRWSTSGSGSVAMSGTKIGVAHETASKNATEIIVKLKP